MPLFKENSLPSAVCSTAASIGVKTLQVITKLEDVVRFLKNIFLISLFALTLPFIYKVLSKHTIVVQEVTVPADFEARGLTGRVFSQRVIDKILEVANYTEALMEREDIYGLSKKNQRPDIDLPISIFGINLETLLSFLRTAVGGQDIRIVGEVITEVPASDHGNIPPQYSVRFRVGKVGTIYKSKSPVAEIDSLAEKAALGVMEEYEPITMAYYYRSFKKFDDAFRMTEKAILNKRPGDVNWAHFVRGLLEADQGRWGLAEEEFRFVLERAPGFPRIHSNLSRALRRKGNFDEALAVAEQAIVAEPNRAAGYIGKAWTLFELGRINEMQPWFEKAIAVEPQSWTVQLDMGDYYRGQRQLDLAAKHYRLALDIKPDASAIYANLAGALGDLGRWKEAETVTQKSLSVNPSNGIALGYIGYIALARGDYERARKFYDEAFAADPTYFRYYIGHARIAMHERRYQDAQQLLEQALAANPRWWDTYKFKGDLALLKGDKPGAMALYQEALKRNAKAPDVLARIAWLAEVQGDHALAQQFSLRAEELAPYLFANQAAVLKDFQFLP